MQIIFFLNYNKQPRVWCLWVSNRQKLYFQPSGTQLGSWLSIRDAYYSNFHED